MSTEKRSVKIFINGKEIDGTLKSIRSEARKLANEINNNLVPGTKEYDKAMAEWKKYNNIIQQHNANLRGTAGVWGSIKAEVKQFGMLAASYFGGQAIISGIQSLIKSSANLDEQMADVAKVTNMTKEEVKDLTAELKKIDTRTSRSELLELSYMAGKLGIQGKEDILGFVRAADQINVALGKDLGADAVQEIGKLVSIFKLEEEYGLEDGMLKIASAINDIGMASTASEGYLVNFLKRMSGISGIAKVSAADNIALAGTLDSLGQTSETSSTAISKTLVTMAKKTQEYANIAGVGIEEFRKVMEENALEALLLVLEGVGKTEGGIETLAATLGDLGADGGRVVGVLGTLAGNVDEVRRQMDIANKAFEDGVSITNEFNIKNTTLQATLDKLGKALAQELSPVELINGLKTMFIWLSENIKQIISTTKVVGKLLLVYGAYIATVKGMTAVMAFYKASVASGILLTEAQTAAYVLLGRVKAILTAQTTRAAKAQALLNLVTSVNPYVLLAAAVAALGTAYFLFSKKVTDASKAEKLMNEARAEAAKSIAKEKSELDTLIRIAQDETKTKHERQKAIEAINKISPEYLGNITLETINTEKGKKAIEDYIKALDKKALAQALNNKKTELYEQLIEKQTKGLNENVNAWDVLKSSILSLGDTQKGQLILTQNTIKRRGDDVESIKNQIEAINNLILQNDDLTGSIINETLAIDENTESYNSNTTAVDESKKAREALAEWIKKQQNEEFLRSLNAKNRDIELVKQKYAEQILLAQEFYGQDSEQYQELTRLMQQEINEVNVKYSKEFYQAWKELNDENWLERIEDLKEKAFAELALEEEKELAKLENLENFDELKLLVEEKYRIKRAKMLEKFNQAEINDEKAKNSLLLQEQIEFRFALANMLGAIAGMLNEGTAGWKFLKVAEAKISMVASMQKAYEAGLQGSGPLAMPMAYMNMASAMSVGMSNIQRIMSTEIPTIPEQYKTGGYRVRGGRDGKVYNASVSGQNGGHVGKNGPTLVLGGEDKPEYWINGEMMGNPLIAQIASALEGVRTRQIAMPDFANIVASIGGNNMQMKSGGYSSAPPQNLNKMGDADKWQFVLKALEQLNFNLENPKPSKAILDYDYYEDEKDFIQKIKDEAKG